MKNTAYLYGLANGTRGALVGVVYGQAGLGSCPEALIVDFPDYCGPQFYRDEPTWVPILPVTEWNGNQSRYQFPVVAGFAMTVNKSQGITAKEGVVINLQGSARYKPAGKHGLPFVAFTRSECFALTAFKNLPGLHEFQQGQNSDMFKMRQAFTQKLSRLHRRTVAQFSDMKTEADEVDAFNAWKALRAARKPSAQAKTCPGCQRRS